MANLVRVVAVWAAAAILSAVGPAAAQENLDAGKSAAQLYASDCAICHKSVQGFAKGLKVRGLDGFLRQHYTASRESAAAISAYLSDIAKGEPGPKGRDASKRKPQAKAALPPRRPAGPKSSSGSKPSEAKASDVKKPEPKPAAAEDQSSAGERAEAKAADASLERQSRRKRSRPRQSRPRTRPRQSPPSRRPRPNQTRPTRLPPSALRPRPRSPRRPPPFHLRPARRRTLPSPARRRRLPRPQCAAR